MRSLSRALRLIALCALDDGTVAELATRLGVGDRHLRQLFAKHVGKWTAEYITMRTLREPDALPATDLGLN